MPCINCNNGRYKFGETGRCIYRSKRECEDANPEDSADNSKHRKKDREKKKKKMSKKRLYGAVKERMMGDECPNC